VLLSRGRKLGDRGDLADARAHPEGLLGVMSEFHRDFDDAQVLKAVVDVDSAVDSQLVWSSLSMVVQLYEEGMHLVAAGAVRHCADQSG
jgi:hypothetical protein